MRFAALVCSVLLAGTAIAADRHVYLNTTGAGGLNDCPNPQHSADGTSNKAKLFYCVGGANAGKVVGTASGRVADCGAGTATAVTNGVSADVDGDGTIEVVYGHPQACVWNMAKSDSCEVHAGTYRQAGAQCNANCGNFSTMGVSIGNCADGNCSLISVAAFGYGPALEAAGYPGYGTAGSPGWLRGAVMNGSIDTWDANGDKIPDVGAYSPILSGDRDADSVFDTTACSGAGNCTGDTYFALLVGCGGEASGGYDSIHCNNALAGSEEPVKINADASADGSFETSISIVQSGAVTGGKNVDYFQVKDIEFTRYNQGNNSAHNGLKIRVANINLNGNANTDGLKLDRIYMHDNSAATGNSWENEIYNAHIADMRNKGCVSYTEVSNSYLEQNNRLFFADEGSAKPALGCSWHIHDNRFLINVQPAAPDAGETAAQPPAFAFLKSYDYHTEDGRPKEFRFWNNEVVIKRMSGFTATNTRFFILENMGNSGAPDGDGRGLGRILVYGNIFRNSSDNTNTLDSFYPSSCSPNTATSGTLWKKYFFNNTWDGWSSAKAIEMEGMCRGSSTATGTLFVERNSVQVYTTDEYGSTNEANATTKSRANNLSSTNASDATLRCGSYFACTGGDPITGSGLAYYAPKTGGTVITAGTCDPDGDGQPGFDTDGDGDQDTTWTDIAGNAVSCPTTGTAIAIGAIQSAAAPSQTCPNGVKEGTEVCDTLDFGTDSCSARGFAAGDLTCVSCTSITTEKCTTSGVTRSVMRGVTIKGGVIP